MTLVGVPVGRGASTIFRLRERARRRKEVPHSIVVNFRKSKKRPDVSAKCTGVKFLDAL